MVLGVDTAESRNNLKGLSLIWSGNVNLVPMHWMMGAPYMMIRYVPLIYQRRNVEEESVIL